MERRTENALVGAIVKAKVFGQEPSEMDKARLKQNLSDYNESLARYEQLLGEHSYLSGPKRTHIDIIIFVGIDTINTCYKREIPAECPKLAKWYKQLADIQEIKENRQKFMEVVTEWDLYGSGN